MPLPASGRERNPNKTDQLAVNVTGRYGFSNSVTGNLELGYSQNRSLLTKINRRNIRLELSARLSF